ncbi:MAG: M20 family metallopeptidase [Roseburia sp.]
MSRLGEQLQKKKEELIQMRRDFHRHPELSLQEFRTAQVIEEELEKVGISHHRIGATGVLGILQGTGRGKGVVALRADIDALPLVETNQAEYCSLTEGVMHACGHDAHTACLLEAAKVLAENRSCFGGEIRFLFQPAEEIGKGASDFIDAGVLKGVERVFGLHLAPDLAIGTIGVTPGLNNAAVDHFRILVKGKAAHVSTPQLGADALYAGCQIMTALQGLVSRRTSPVEPVIIGVGKFHAGTTYNAVPGAAELEGTTRTISEEMRMQVRRWVDETAAQMSALSGATAEVIWNGITPALINDAEVSAEVKEVAASLSDITDRKIKVMTDRPISLGGDNFAEFQRVVPGCYAYLGTANPELENSLNSLHNGNFDLDEEALLLGAGLYTEYALWWLMKE